VAGSVQKRPALDGSRSSSVAHVIAGPLAGTLYGRSLVPSRPRRRPGAGDQVGPWPVQERATSGEGLGSQQRSVTIDLRNAEGQSLPTTGPLGGVVINHVRVNTLDVGPRLETLHRVNPGVLATYWHRCR